MEDESIQKDEEKLKSLLETLKKNDENVPEELLKTKYKKPYRELKDSIKEVADQISGRRIRQDIVIKNDDAGQVLIVAGRTDGEVRGVAGKDFSAGAVDDIVPGFAFCEGV